MPLCTVYTGDKLTDIAGYLKGYKDVFIVSDRNVSSFARSVESALDGVRGVLEIDATELNKNMSTVLDICGWLMSKNADRNAMLLAVGGGITTDMAGFAASIYKRGIRFAYVPTTLLSQVDAAVGGKTGVNFDNYKNILGVIRQPEFTYICAEVLGSLSKRDFLSGEAELLKTFIIDNSEGNYEAAVQLFSTICRSRDFAGAVQDNITELTALIGAAAKIKAGVVERDEFEHGERRKLNLGHTFAHAIEWESRSAGTENISHGEAVAIGMVLAARLSESYYKDIQSGLADKLAADLAFCGLPVVCPFTMDSMAGAMTKDKKAEDGKVNFVLIHSIGDVRIEKMSVYDALELIG